MSFKSCQVTFRSSFICQDVEERAPRNSNAREEAADSGEKVKLLSEFSLKRARYILKQESSDLSSGSSSSPECHVVVHFYKVLGSFVQPTGGHPKAKIAWRSLGKAFCVFCQRCKVLCRVMTVPITMVMVVTVLVVMMLLMVSMVVTMIMTVFMVVTMIMTVAMVMVCTMFMITFTLVTAIITKFNLLH